jgi:hypothetical protein
LDERYVVAILPGNTLRVQFSHERGFCGCARKNAPLSVAGCQQTAKNPLPCPPESGVLPFAS